MSKVDQTPYIEPNFSLATSFEKLLENYKQYNYFLRYFDETQKMTLQDILNRKILFILAEPGQGKTRLLNELVREHNGQSILVDLKQKNRDESIESFIKRTNVNGVDPAKPSLILLDALDEVSPKDVISTINHIKIYINQNPEHKVFVSCRIHFFTKYEYSVSGLDQAEFLLIEALETRQAKDFLRKLGVDQASIITLFESIKFIGREAPTVLHTPRYLEMLSEYIRDNPQKAKALNRADLFEAFVNKALLIEDNKNGRQLALYKKRFLEKLALVMEIAQVNVISEDDLLTFIDEVKSDVKMALINQIDIEDIYEHSLLKKTGQEISFANAEIQEYLAAKGILRLKDPIRTVFDIAIEPNIREPLPSWSNTLSFVIDEIPSLAVKILNIKSEIPTSEDEVWHRLVTGSTSPSLSKEDKELIFNRVWGYYSERRQIASGEILLRLANYAPDKAVLQQIKKLRGLRLNPINRENAVNVIHLLGDFITLNKIPNSELKSIKNKLVNLSLKSNDKIIQHNAINALRDCKDPTLIDKLFKLISSDDDLVVGSLQGLAYDLDKNSPKSIEIFVDGIKRGRESYSLIGIEDIDDPKALSIFLKILSKDTQLIKEIIEHNSVFIKDDHKFLNNIIRYWQNNWLNYLKSFVISAIQIESGYYAERSDLVTEIVKLIASKDGNYFSQLINSISKDGDKGLHLLFAMSHNLTEIMTIDDIPYLKRVMDGEDRLKHFLFRDLLTGLSRAKNTASKEIENWARREYADLYEQYDKKVEEYRKLNEQDKLTEKFAENVLKAQEKDEVISANAVLKAMETLENNLSDQSSHKEKIKFTEDQVEVLWARAKEKFLDPFDPAATKLQIENRDDKDTKHYTITRSTPWFQLAVKFGYATKRQDLADYRKKLISLIPYAYYGEMKAILATLGSLDDNEKELAIQAYRDITSDTAQFMPDNLVEISEEYLIHSAVPILDGFVDFDKLHNHIRVKSLEVSDLLKPSLGKLQAIFSKYKDFDEGVNKELALKANELMVTKHKDRSSIIWRVEYVKRNSFEYLDQITEGFHAVGVFENEIHEGNIVKPLKNISDDSYMSDFLNLLVFSFGLIEKGITWHNYASYIWAVVDQYFTNLVANGTYTPINKLEECVASYPNQDAVVSYIRHLSAVKRSYLEALGKPQSFTACIQKLNILSSQNYLPITSSKHLYEIVADVIEDDLSKWVAGEGRKLLPDDESAAQRNLLIKLDNLFLRKGFAKSDINEEILILRESQAEDDTRTDFLMYYGFYGPILIELKKSSHSDLTGRNLQSKKSYKSLEKYMRQFRAEYGILLVYETKDRSTEEWQAHLADIRSAYVNIKGISVIGLLKS